ncbi:MAG: type IX secretion system protein PorQ [Melioribacteraceae bacterium]|nr:type IX secretion system protein PorQ [Melioribacteraceae bacterium]
MKKINYYILLFLLSTSLNAQSIYEFLKLDLSPRAAALAGSFVSTNDDPNVILYNPAGISYLSERPISVSYLNHLLDINFMGAVYSQEIEGLGRFAAAVTYTNYGSFTEADEFGTKLGEFGASDLLMTVGYSNELDQNFYYGANIKFIYSGIADYSSTGLAFDLGLSYAMPESDLYFGFSALNIGSQLSTYAGTSESLPLDVRVGISKKLTRTPFKLFLSLNKLNESADSFGDRFQNFTFGTEIKLGTSFNIRIGYDNEKRKELKIGSSTGLSGISFGVGFAVSEYVVDYAYSSLGSIGALHRFGLSTSL